MMDCGCAFGIVVLTAVYVGFVIAIDYNPWYYIPKCLDEPCNSEGVDNYTLNWSTDFFLAVAMLAFAIHLFFSKRKVLTTAILTQLFMSAAYIQFGLANMMYPNDATGDGKGLKFYWILSWIAYFCLTLSTITLVAFAEKASQMATSSSRNKQQRKYLCHVRALRFFMGLVIAFSITFLVGCVWCGISPEIHVDEIVDEYYEAVPHPKCVRLIEGSEFGWRISYTLLWVPASLLLRAAVSQNPETILELPSPCAPLDIILIQSTIGFVFHVWIEWAAHALVYDPVELFENVYGSIIIHYGMLLTFYMLHGLSVSLADNKDGKGDCNTKLEKMEKGEKSIHMKADVEKTIPRNRRKHKTGTRKNRHKKIEIPLTYFDDLNNRSSQDVPTQKEISTGEVRLMDVDHGIIVDNDRDKTISNHSSRRDISKTKCTGKRKPEMKPELEREMMAKVDSSREPPIMVESKDLYQKRKRDTMMGDTAKEQGLKNTDVLAVASNRNGDQSQIKNLEIQNMGDVGQGHSIESKRSDIALASDSVVSAGSSTYHATENVPLPSILPGSTMQAVASFQQAATAAMQAAVQGMNSFQLPAAFNCVTSPEPSTSPPSDSDQVTVSTANSSQFDQFKVSKTAGEQDRRVRVSD